MKKTSKILIIGEIQNQHAAHVTVELLGEGRKLADSLDAELILTIVGNDVEKTCKDLLRYPADRIIAADHPSLKQKQLETHSRILYEIVKEQKPDMILGGATLFGKTLLPTLAAMLGTEVMTDAVGLEIDKETGELLVTKPAFDGKSMSVVSMPEAPVQMALAKPGVFKKACETDGRKGKFTAFSADWLQEITERKRTLDLIKEEKKISLEDVHIIAAGGRGLKGPEGFRLLLQFAERIGAQAGCTRPCVDAGWMLPEQQIGQTGCITKPDIYIAFGISGAVQHMTGVRAGTVIAVNSNPNAAVFKYCDYGIVGDAKKILEEFLKLPL